MTQLSRPLGVPDSAICVRYSPKTQVLQYYVWLNMQSKWYWHALGTEGEEVTMPAACESARRFIRDGEFNQLT